MKRLVVATGNENKVVEIREILRDFPIEVLSLKDLNIDVEVMEDGDTFEENAYKKAWEVMKITGLPTLADDSGLQVDYLGGAPGVHSARFSGEHGNSVKNNEKLLELMKGVPMEERKARFVCSMVLLYPDGEKITARGEIEGYIATELKGSEGFGYDPLFIVPEYNKTFGELGRDIKNSISHRGKALRDLREKLKDRV